MCIGRVPCSCGENTMIVEVIPDLDLLSWAPLGIVHRYFPGSDMPASLLLPLLTGLQHLDEGVYLLMRSRLIVVARIHDIAFQ